MGLQLLSRVQSPFLNKRDIIPRLGKMPHAEGIIVHLSDTVCDQRPEMLVKIGRKTIYSR